MAEWTIASDCKSDARRATEVRILSCPPYKKRKSELARASPDFFVYGVFELKAISLTSGERIRAGFDERNLLRLGERKRG